MERLAVLVSLVPLAVAQFVPPDVILQAGYPAGFRAFIPDFPGCELFAFHAKVNSPFDGDEDGTFFQEILRPQDGFWIYQDLNLILTPGDIIHYWTMIIKDETPFVKKNQTWKVPDPDESVDLLKPVSLRPPPQKMRDTEPTTASEEPTTSMGTTEPSSPESTEPSSSSATTPPLTKPNRSTVAPMNADVEELTTPAPPPFDKPITSDFPREPPPLFPFPTLFPRPFKPMMPPNGPGFEICSNPWNFEEQVGESRTQRLERQVAKLQCELALFQRGYTQLGNTVENELTDMKKLIYGMVGRMARLESLIRTAAFG